jgi:hypothetical protein
VGNGSFRDDNICYCNVDGLDPGPTNDEFQEAFFQEKVENESKTVFPTLVSTQFPSKDRAEIPTVALNVSPTNQMAAPT